jgi:hypothetical protein
MISNDGGMLGDGFTDLGYFPLAALVLPVLKSHVLLLKLMNLLISQLLTAHFKQL